MPLAPILLVACATEFPNLADPAGTDTDTDTETDTGTDETSIQVLLLSPDSYGSPPLDTTMITGIFDSFSDCDTQIFDTGAEDPDLSDLLLYDVVIVGNGNTWESCGGATATGVGNALAAYLDAGGAVIESAFVHDYYGWELEGDYITDGYGPFYPATSDVDIADSMIVLDGTHPVMAGVTSLSMTASDPILNLTLRPGAAELGQWDATMHPAVAVSGDGQVVGFNFRLFGDSVVTGDVDTLLHNAVIWLANGD